MAPIPDFVPLLLTASAVALVVAFLILVRGSRGGEVSQVEAVLTPFAMPVGTLAFIAIVITGIGSLLLQFDKQTAPIVALVLTVAIMVGCYFMSQGSAGNQQAQR